MGMFDDDALPTVLANLYGDGPACRESYESVFTVEVTP